VHFGRRRQSRVVSSAIAYWQLSVEMRSALVAVIEEQSTPQQYRDYCEIIITAGHLLGR
jgi:hypothetical protein